MRHLPVVKDLARGAARRIGAAINSDLMPEFAAQRVQRVMQTVKDNVESRAWPDRPQSLNFEITAICDARCVHCPRHEMDRSQRPMELALFKKMVDEAAEMQIPELCPNGFGELLTMRNLGEYFAYVRSKSHRFRLVVNSNGFRMTDEKIDEFLRYEVDLINITLDGATAETFESIRVNLKLATIEDNIHRLLAERKRRKLELPKIRVGMIVLPQNQHEVDALMDKWRNVVDFVGLGGFTNRAGSLDESFAALNPGGTAKACVLPFRDMNVWADGKVVLCCDDWNEEHVVGDLNTQSLREIWQGPRFSEARRRHLAGRGGDVDLCARCNYWRDPSPGARLWA